MHPQPPIYKTCRHADVQTCRHTDIQTCRHAYMQTFRHTGIQTYRHFVHISSSRSPPSPFRLKVALALSRTHTQLPRPSWSLGNERLSRQSRKPSSSRSSRSQSPRQRPSRSQSPRQRSRSQSPRAPGVPGSLGSTPSRPRTTVLQTSTDYRLPVSRGLRPRTTVIPTPTSHRPRQL